MSACLVFSVLIERCGIFSESKHQMILSILYFMGKGYLRELRSKQDTGRSIFLIQ
ncbi:MAG: hypothetical protein ACD_2C00258G0003 [uncultured bacterium (gcode 4)]|uniref:Uncharacterized protein n=1 Tax=uncultured bacterium (gcode 4) TaxID=1234023 RepID=K2G153_9BACT|nr:MAG: hypothetical protein ACD_2C00258G0003 [uncultured bacterium (gcode 4)]